MNEIGTIRIASMMLRSSEVWRTTFRYSRPITSSENSVRAGPEQASATSNWYWPICRITPVRAIG